MGNGVPQPAVSSSRSKRNPAFGLALQAVRNALRLSQDTFGARLGVSRRTLTRWEIHNELPPVAQRKHIATSFPEAPSELRKALVESLGLDEQFAVQVTKAKAGEAVPGALEAALLAMAEHLDIGPKRVRDALHEFVTRAHEGGLTLESIRRSLAAKPEKKKKRR